MPYTLKRAFFFSHETILAQPNHYTLEKEQFYKIGTSKEMTKTGLCYTHTRYHCQIRLVSVCESHKRQSQVIEN